jgi:hypothetical protein
MPLGAYAWRGIFACNDPFMSASGGEKVRSPRTNPDPTQGTSIVRFRFALAVMVAGMLFAAGIASAQSTTTEPLSGYTNTTTTETQPSTQTTEATTETSPAKTTEEDDSAAAPTVAAQPAGTAPSNLAFTGGEPLLLIALGLALAGGTATLLVRDRRRGASQNR